jgi:hypothetical protein
VIPNCKIQSNFTFTMAPSGDPSGQMRLAAWWQAEKFNSLIAGKPLELYKLQRSQ